MFQLKRKPSKAQPDGKTFLREARDEHEELFTHFVANADVYDSVNAYTDALQSQAWEITENIVKQSYANGIRRGRSVRSTQKADA